MIKILVDKIADRIRWGYLTAFIILLITYIVSFVYTQNLMKQSRLVNHAKEVIYGLENLVGFVARSESAAKGYIITGRKEILQKYNQSKSNADSAYRSVKLLLTENTQQQKNLDTLNTLIIGEYAWLEQIFKIFDSTHTISSQVLIAEDQVIQRMSGVEIFTMHMQNNERQLLQSRNMEVTKYSKIIKVIIIISLFVAIVLTLYSIITFTRENKEKRKANLEAIAYRKQLEVRVKELAELNKELIELRNIEKFAATGRISRTIAHEVRNPLTNINLAVDQIRSEVPQGKEVNLLLEMISRNSRRINQLINDLLHATRITELCFVKCTINEVLENSLSYALDRIELKHITVEKNYDDHICQVMVDKDKIEMAFLNIIINAIEAMDDHGMLKITIERKNERCIVKISDNGRGIAKEDLDRLFEPYFTTKERGSGLGLTHTQNIIFAHNAGITVQSEPGKGTSVTISIALA
jgi:signal transduction histidine kinase